MSDYIRIDLAGRNGEAWDQVFQTLTDVIVAGVTRISPSEEVTERSAIFTAHIAALSKKWLQAKVERPSLENEKLVAEIAGLFEDGKLKRAQVEKLEIENESARLDLLEKRVMMAVRLLGFLNNHITREPDGNLVLILTNDNLATMRRDLKAITQDTAQP
jgi:hypothetical protein